jgi:hypothetical protein
LLLLRRPMGSGGEFPPEAQIEALESLHGANEVISTTTNEVWRSDRP